MAARLPGHQPSGLCCAPCEHALPALAARSCAPCEHALPACLGCLQLRLNEKRILRGTMDGVRRRLAPIRGIPTKVGSVGGGLRGGLRGGWWSSCALWDGWAGALLPTHHESLRQEPAASLQCAIAC